MADVREGDVVLLADVVDEDVEPPVREKRPE